jgi:hypothetical protein
LIKRTGEGGAHDPHPISTKNLRRLAGANTTGETTMDLEKSRPGRWPAGKRGQSAGSFHYDARRDADDLERERGKAERGSARLLARLIEQHGPNDRDDLFVTIGETVHSTVVHRWWQSWHIRPVAYGQSMSRSKKSGNPKTEMTLVRNPEVDDVAALFEQLTGRKPTAAEMLEVKQTLGPVPTLEFPRPSHCGVERHTKGAGTESPAARRCTPTWLPTNQIWNQSCSPGQKPFR